LTTIVSRTNEPTEIRHNRSVTIDSRLFFRRRKRKDIL